MRLLRQLLWPAAIVFGIGAEWVGRPELVLLDGVAGFALLGSGLVARSSRPESRCGAIMAAGAVGWFLGTLWAPAVFLVRGPLAHLLLSYPSGRVASRANRAAVVAAYAYAAGYPVAADDGATIVFGAGIAGLCLRRYVAARGPRRRPRLGPLAAGIALGAVLVLDAAVRLADVGGVRAPLAVYDLVVALIGIGLCGDLVRARWSEAAVTGLVVDLGVPSHGAQLRGRLARALGDPTVEVGYRLPDRDGYVDDAGRPLEIAAPGAGRALLPIEVDGERVAVLVHDAAVVADPALRRAVSAAMRLALENARLQADVRSRLAAVAASRRRIVQASDDQRRRLERDLRNGPERRLARVADLLEEAGPPFLESCAGLAAARAELREFARGVHPSALTEGGLRAAVDELAARSPVPVRVVGSPGSFELPIEAAAYFVCSESLANVAKYARASHVRIELAERDAGLHVIVVDDGIGGADASRGSGLHGLADRVDALGGRLRVESPPGRGTTVAAVIPVTRDQG